MLIKEIILFKTPMEINGENRFFPDEAPSKVSMKASYFNFLKNTFNHISIEATQNMESFKGINVGDSFTVTLPINFLAGHQYNYACIRTTDTAISDYHRMFYFVKANRENNSMANMQYTFYLDHLIEYSYEIYQHKDRQVLKERSHIPYIEYVGGINRIKNGTRVLNTYSKPTITEFVEGSRNVVFPYDILWYDVQLTRFQREYADVDAGSGTVAPYYKLLEFTTEQNWAEGFASTYHVFRPYKVYYRGTKTEVKGVTFQYYREARDYGVYTSDTIVDPKEVEFRKTTDNVASISLTFNPPFSLTWDGSKVIIYAFGSRICEVETDEQISEKHFMYMSLTREPIQASYTITFNNNYNLSIPVERQSLISKETLIDNSPLLRYSNLYTYNIIFNNTVIPIYSEKYTSEIKAILRLFPKDEGAIAELVLRDEDKNVLFNSQNLLVTLNKNGTIPYTVSQLEAYKVANSNRIKANIIGKIASGAVTIATLGVAGGLANGSWSSTGLVEYVGKKLPLDPLEETDPFTITESKQGAKFDGERATRIMNIAATYADLNNLVTLAGQSSQNAMMDLFYQDRILFTITLPIDKYCESMFSFCKEYQDYGAIINREDEFLTLFKDLESFIYIKTVDIQLPISSAHNSAINAIFNRGVRLWHCIEQNQNIADFNTMISNYER